VVDFSAVDWDDPDLVIGELRAALALANATLDGPGDIRSGLDRANVAAARGLFDIHSEVAKGSTANPIVAEHQDRLRQTQYGRLDVLARLDSALDQRPHDEGFYKALDSLCRGPSANSQNTVRQMPPPARDPTLQESAGAIAPLVADSRSWSGDGGASSAKAPRWPAPASGAPLFTEVSADYINARIGADGEHHKDIQYLRLRRRTWIDLIGDRPVDQYGQKDLQDYVNLMQFWPANVTKRSDFAALSTREIIDRNRKLTLQPLARKTLEDGYVANIKTMFRAGMADHRYRYPFADARIHWPQTMVPSKPREGVNL
jgi:hypothetical protein